MTRIYRPTRNGGYYSQGSWRYYGTLILGFMVIAGLAIEYWYIALSILVVAVAATVLIRKRKANAKT
jgi:hypothetical protein